MEYLSKFVMSIFDNMNIDEAIDKSVLKHDSEIEDLNLGQLKQGLKSNGGNTGEYKNIEYKGRLRPVDLNKTGSFYKGITATSKSGILEIDGKDSKTGLLQDIYGDDILGLTDENANEVADIIVEDVAFEIINQITR